MSNDDIQHPLKFDKKAREAELKKLQVKFAKMQQWVVETGARIVIVMEGRDATGRGLAIKRITQYLNPRTCRIEALSAPASRKQGQWYFQRYTEKPSTIGEIMISDRSWYNRVGVECVMDFHTLQEYCRFLCQAPIFERLLVEDDIILCKHRLSILDEEQIARFKFRREGSLRCRELSPMDLEPITHWEDYSCAKDEMFTHADIPSVLWYTVESEDRKRSRINIINCLLMTTPYEHIRREVLGIPGRPESEGIYERLPRAEFRYIPDAAAEPEANRPRGEDKFGKKGKKHKEGKKSKKE